MLIRDVAYGMLPKAVRRSEHFEVARYIEERSGDRTEEVVGLLAEHYGRAATLAPESGLDRPTRARLNAKALEVLEAAGDAAAALYSNLEAFDRYATACELGVADGASRARLREKQGDVALLLGRVDPAIEAWEECVEYQRHEEDLPRLADLNRKVGAALWQKGAVKGAIERYQRGIALLKDGPPARELVRLYEEAATLYMHTGDNMLAIYAAEKALRLAERMEEAGAASRAHEVFGRVFGRMGDGAKARENLERSVELARSSGPTDTIRALIALGSHLDMSEADYDGAAAAYSEARELSRRLGDLTAEAELHSALALLAAYRADWEDVAAHAEASLELAEREGLARSLAYPYALQGLLRWRAGDFAEAEDLPGRALAIAGDRLVRGRVLGAVRARQVLRDRVTYRVHSSARAVARCLRASRSRRTIHTGHCRTSRQSDARRQAGTGPRGGRRGGTPRRAASLSRGARTSLEARGAAPT